MNDRLALQASCESVIGACHQWASSQGRIRALALVGSHARNHARVRSDIDLVVLTDDTLTFRAHAAWLDEIDWSNVGARPARWRDEDYGRLWSRRVWLADDVAEIEFGFALPSWANVNPVDAGTRRVIEDGCRVLHDPDGVLYRLCASTRRRPS